MFRLTATLLLAAFSTAPALAQLQDKTPTDTGTANQDFRVIKCVLTCSMAALASSRCTGVTDFLCVCTDAEFQTAARACIEQTCPEQADDGMRLQRHQCDIFFGEPSPHYPSSAAGGSSGGPSERTSTIYPDSERSQEYLVPQGTHQLPLTLHATLP